MSRTFVTLLRKSVPFWVGAALLVLLLVLSRYSYLLFHGITEMFSIAVAAAVFMLVWNARRFLDNDYLLFIGIAYLFAAAIDLVHTLSYEGMGIFTGYDANVPTQLWIGARYLQALSLLIAPVFLTHRLRPAAVFAVYAAAVAVFFWDVFGANAFPDCYDVGAGQTPFKIVSEYVISGIFAAGLALLAWQRRRLGPKVWKLLAASVVVAIASEISFTHYVSVYGTFNLVGHILKILSFYLIYKAVVETGLSKPYELLFLDLKRSEEGLRQAERELKQVNESLERRVAERTAVAEQRASQLQAMALALTQAEHQERRRLARLLHDHLQQLLAAAKLRLGFLRAAAAPKDVQEEARRVDDLLSQSIDASRSLTFELSPPVLHDGGLAPALDWLSGWMLENHDLAVDVSYDRPDGPAGDDMNVFLFQAVRELLFNVRKHAGVNRARVTMSHTDDARLRIVIEDEGAGFDPAAVKGDMSGFGLFSIRERADLLGGSFEIDSAPGRGSRFTLLAPLQ